MAWREKRHAEKTARRRAAEVALIEKGRVILRGALAIVDGAGIDAPLVLKRGEKALFSLEQSGLFEPRSGGGQWQGRSSGFSIPVAGRVRYRVGQTHGHYVKNPEVPTIIDTGSTTITDQRVVFMGSKRTSEWLLSKLIGVSHAETKAWTTLQVSNRQKVSGFTYPPPLTVEVHLWLAIAPELFNGRIEEVRSELRGQLDALDNEVTAGESDEWAENDGEGVSETTLEPARGLELAPPRAPLPGWLPDPFGRFQFRYWDGSRWTEHVATDSLQSVDRPNV